MPIFNDEITFIHIPKTGGDSIEKFVKDNGYDVKFRSTKKQDYINGHSPQHCTYRELKEMGLLTNKIFTVIRPNIDRVISEYFYLRKYSNGLEQYVENFDIFLNYFLDKKNSLIFDNHNLHYKEFIIGENGEISKDIKIFNFFDVKSIEEYLGMTGLSNFHSLKPDNERYEFKLTEEQKNKINRFYDENS